MVLSKAFHLCIAVVHVKKYEARNSKSETNSKFEYSNDKNKKISYLRKPEGRTFYGFEFLSFNIRICFEFRDSNFEFIYFLGMYLQNIDE